MKFLLRLFSIYVDWLLRRPRDRSANTRERAAAGPRELARGELVTRFIYSSNQLSKANGRPKPPAFEPPKNGELSTVHSTDLPNADIWNIGKLTFGSQAGRSRIYARADVPVRAFIEKKLHAIRDDDPFERHTSVIGWPRGADADDTKQQWKMICLELSQDPTVKLIVPDAPVTRSAV